MAGDIYNSHKSERESIYLCLTYGKSGDMMCLLIKEAMTEKAGISALSESSAFGVSRIGKDTAATAPEQVSER